MRLQRFVILVLLGALALLVLPNLVSGHGLWRPELHVAYAKPQKISYTVKPGDTLWGIARRIAPGKDPRPVIDELIADNHLHGTLQAGQAIELPAPIH